jgi:predicted permease
MQHVWPDLRYALRQLRKSPGFTATVVLTLALGMGATTAIFSAVYGLLLKSLPFPDAARIVSVAETHPKIPGGIEATYPDYEDWRAQQRAFTEIGAYSTINPTMASLVVDGRPESVHRVLASGNFFSLLGVSAQIGRTISARDDVQGSDHVAVLSAAAWQRYFGGDRGVIGRSVDLDGANFTVIGVLPPGASFPAEGEVWLPLSLLDQPTRVSRVWHSVKVLGRLRAGVGMPESRTEMQAIAARLAAAYPATNRGVGVAVSPLRDQLVGTLRPAILSLLGVVVLVLLIACANVANLFLVRATSNRREAAVRLALGADRSRVFSQFFALALLLCLAGGALGLALAAATLPLLRLALAHTAGLDASMIQSVSLNRTVLLVALGVCTLTAVLFAVLPGMRGSFGAAQVNLVEDLRPGDRGNTGGHRWGRGTLIAGEIAIAVVVLFLSSLVMRSYQKLLAVDPGFRTDHLLSAEISLPQPRYTDSSETTAHFYQQLLAKLSDSPGVISASTTTQTPLMPSQVMTRFLIEGAPPTTPGAFPVAQIRFVSAEYFRTMGLAVQAGRLFNQKDVEDQASYAIVNAAFARKYLAGRQAEEAKILLGVLSPQPQKFPVIGVVANAHDLGIDSDPQPEMYLPGFGLHAVLQVRSAIDPESLVPIVRNAVHGVDPNQPIYHVQTAQVILDDSLARQRMTATLLSIFAGVAVVLAAIGIYGVLSYSVAQSRREIGVRMALGANRADILKLMLGQTSGFAIGGFVAGLGAAIAGARLMNGLLFKISTVDPLSIAIAISGLALIAGLAVTMPARCAATVNPMEALRSE